MGYYPRLRDLREDADLTQEELVKLLKMHKTTYTNYEQGKREPPFELIIKLAKFYDVSIDYIAGLSEETSKETDFAMQAAVKEVFWELKDEERLIVALSVFGGYFGDDTGTVERFANKVVCRGRQYHFPAAGEEPVFHAGENLAAETCRDVPCSRLGAGL